VARLAAICNIRRKALLLVISVSMPMTTGWLQPLIIIPRGLGKILTAAEFGRVSWHTKWRTSTAGTMSPISGCAWSREALLQSGCLDNREPARS
jgi:hypothetical protein